MNDPILHALESDGPEEEDDEHDVGIDGSHVDHFRILRDALDDAQIHQYPRNDETTSDDEVEASRVVDLSGNVESLAVPKIFGGAAGLNMSQKSLDFVALLRKLIMLRIMGLR